MSEEQVLDEETTRYIMDTLASNIIENGAHDFASEISDLADECGGNWEWLSLKVDLGYLIPLRSAVQKAIKDRIGDGQEQKWDCNLSYVVRYYANYQQGEAMLEKMMESLFGVCCCADRARSVMQVALSKMVGNEDWDKAFSKAQKDGMYYVPPIGDADDWVNIANGAIWDKYDSDFMRSCGSICSILP